MHTVAARVAATFAVFFLAASCASAGPFCERFTISPQFLCIRLVCDYYPLSHQNELPYLYRASKAQICSPGMDPGYPFCDAPEQAGLEITQPGLVNISTLAQDEKSALFSLIAQAFTDLNISAEFPLSATAITQSNSSYSSTTPDGQCGFLALFPTVDCVEGVLDGCDPGSSVADMTPVRACAPDVDPYGGLILGGVQQIVTNDTAVKMGSGPVPTPAQPISMVPVSSVPDRYLTYYSTTPVTIQTTVVPAYTHPPYSTPTTLPIGH